MKTDSKRAAPRAGALRAVCNAGARWLLAGVLLGTTAWSAAADFPAKPIKLIIPFATGGAVTFLTEHIMKEMEVELGQPIVRDYRGGAGGTIAMEAAGTSAPDGYTMFIVSTSQAISAGVYDNLKVDVVKDFAPVTLLATTPYVLVINPDIPAKSVRELVAYGKANPGKLVLGTSGAGNSDDIIGTEFARQAGIELIHVPYRGAGPAIPDLVTGRVNVTFFSPLPTKAFVADGKLRLLAVTMKQRSPAMPNVPTIAEQGMPDFDFPGWYGLAVPAATPPAVVARLQRAAAAALAKPAVRDFLAQSGLSPGGGPSAEFASFLVSETARWSALARKMGVKPE
jgi:tripartite-type tricarboxylate transporter receptor subunit TctC